MRDAILIPAAVAALLLPTLARALDPPLPGQVTTHAVACTQPVPDWAEFCRKAGLRVVDHPLGVRPVLATQLEGELFDAHLAAGGGEPSAVPWAGEFWTRAEAERVKATLEAAGAPPCYVVARTREIRSVPQDSRFGLLVVAGPDHEWEIAWEHVYLWDRRTPSSHVWLGGSLAGFDTGFSYPIEPVAIDEEAGLVHYSFHGAFRTKPLDAGDADPRGRPATTPLSDLEEVAALFPDTPAGSLRVLARGDQGMAYVHGEKTLPPGRGLPEGARFEVVRAHLLERSHGEWQAVDELWERGGPEFDPGGPFTLQEFLQVPDLDTMLPDRMLPRLDWPPFVPPADASTCEAFLVSLSPESSQEEHLAARAVLKASAPPEILAAYETLEVGEDTDSVLGAIDVIENHFLAACGDRYRAGLRPAAGDREAAQGFYEALVAGDREAAASIASADVLARFSWSGLKKHESVGAPSLQLEEDGSSFAVLLAPTVVAFCDVRGGAVIDCRFGE